MARLQMEKEIEQLMNEPKKQTRRESSKPSKAQDSMNTLNTVLLSESEFDSLFIVVRVGPPESFNRSDMMMLKYSISAEEFYYGLFYHPDVFTKFQVVFFA
jgi:hypothetical protein